jgi:guanine deaminase
LSVPSTLTLCRGELWHVARSPLGSSGDLGCLESFEDGALVFDSTKKIIALGNYAHLKAKHRDAKVQDFTGKIIIPGFIDAHLHFPQLDMIGSYGEDLLGWLNKYTFPTEARFSNPAIAKATAKRFFRELTANGTTTAAIFSSSHKVATDVLFNEAEAIGVRAIIGKVSMDQNAPDALLQTPQVDCEETVQLVKKWHRRADLLFYALTPRFAPTCTAKMLASLGKIKNDYPDLYIQTHHAETEAEIKWVRELFPKAKDYLSIYDEAGLLGERTILGHSIHPTTSEMKRLKATNTKVAHCPTSNLFLGSGLFPWQKMVDADIAFALGSDVGGGTSLSLWKTMAEAYKVQQLQKPKVSLSATKLFYAATLGGAKVLNLESQTGNFQVGKSADFQVIDPSKNELLKARLENSHSVEEKLFALIFLGDDRITDQVFVAGRKIL